MIKFAGVRSDDMNLIVEHYPAKVFPERSYEVIEVPGRDGDVVIDNGNFKNYRQTYSVFINSNDPDEAIMQRISSKIAEWLLSNPGYQRLEDSYDPEFYRMAYYSGGTNFSNFFNTYGRGSLEFTCAPRRYYKSGDEQLTLTSGSTIYSPSVFKADPIIEFVGVVNTTSTITVNGNSVSFSIDNLPTPVIVDVENHTAKHGNGQRITMSSGNYEDLKLIHSDAGNTISFTNISSFKITPRWWTL